jgi:uncharacterized membrane protein YheB (UPF0754 family)
MNKSVMTNVIATGFILVAMMLEGPLKDVILSIGLFALAGGVTNWLAIHMLFEKVPGLYGSGVISARFEQFKSGIHALVMEQFFSQANLDRFFAEMIREDADHQLDFSQVIDETDLTPAFNGLVETIMNSSFSSMLAMIGGEAALAPMKEPFIAKMKVALNDVAHSPSFQHNVKAKLSSAPVSKDIFQQVEHVVNARLDELTPQMVKDIIQTMIRQHLGWLVVWGGVFGGLIGLLTSQIDLFSRLF